MWKPCKPFKKLTKRYPNTAYGKQAWLWQGESLIRQGQYTTAEQLYTEITKRFPHDEDRDSRLAISEPGHYYIDVSGEMPATQFQQVAPLTVTCTRALSC
jgi:hypothetical protein